MIAKNSIGKIINGHCDRLASYILVTRPWHRQRTGKATFMPLRKRLARKARPKHSNAASQPFPLEAYRYDSDVIEKVTHRVQEQADKILAKDKWVVIDGVKKR